jgi:membrane-associated phospholipid phosphatase
VRPHPEILTDLSALGGQWVYTFAAFAALALGDVALFFRLLLGLAFCFAVLIPIRLVYPKPRPEPRTRSGWYGRLDNPSFPSLHAMRAAAFATVLSFRFPADWFVALNVLLVIGVCWMRVLFRRHSIADVLAGTVFGAVCGAVGVYFVT